MTDFPIIFEWKLAIAGYHTGDGKVERVPGAKGAKGRRRQGAPQLKIGRPERLFPNDKPQRVHRPLDSYRHLFLYFTELDGSPEACEAFAGKYGPLTRPGTTMDGEPLALWSQEIRVMRSYVQLAQENLPELVARIEGVQRADLRATLVKAPPDGRPVLALMPPDLKEAMWLQLLQGVAAGWPFRKCDWCSTWFEAGPGPTAWRRAGSRFCKDECRSKFNNAKRATKEIKS